MKKSKHSPRVDETYRIVNRVPETSAALPRDPEHRGNRHGRSEAARKAVLQAADNLLVEKGFADFTIEGIAARAGVGKQTIYRWWASKADILLDAFLEDAAERLTPPELGDLGADMRSHLRNCAEFFSQSDAGAVFRALVGEAQHDEKIASRLRVDYISQQRDRDRAPLRRAIERGELSPDVDMEMALEQLVAPVHYRILVSGEPVTPDYTDLLVERFLTRCQGAATRKPSVAKRSHGSKK